MDPVIPEDILLVIALVMLVGPLAWLAGRWLIAGAADARSRLMAAARVRTRATVRDNSGDGGGHPMPAPADYSDEVTDEHFKRIAELVDQHQFKNAKVLSGPAWPHRSRPKAPETGSGLRFGAGDTAAGWPPTRN